MSIETIETSRTIVADIMVRRVQTVQATTSAFEAAKLMGEHNIRHLVVTQSNGRPIGVLSSQDITAWLKYLSPNTNNGSDQKPSTNTDVQEIMTTDLTTVTPDTSLATAAGILADKKIGCLLVIDTDKIALAGILTVVDVMRHVQNAPPANNVDDDEFEFYVPPRSAQFTKNDDLILPSEFLDNGNFDDQVFAMLGYSQKSKRVVIQLLPETRPGARAIVVDKNRMVIPATDFRNHYQIKARSSFEITEDENSGCLILSPSTSS